MSTSVKPQTGLGRTILIGLISGVVAGIVFVVFEMIVAAIMGNGLFAPLRMIGAIALGQSVLMASSPLLVPVIVGAVVHMMLSAIYGMVFAAAAHYITMLRRNTASLLTATTVFGLALWVVNFHVFSPLLFPWFGASPPTVGVIAHTFSYGTMLGVLLLVFGLPMAGRGAVPRVGPKPSVG